MALGSQSEPCPRWSIVNRHFLGMNNGYNLEHGSKTLEIWQIPVVSSAAQVP